LALFLAFLGCRPSPENPERLSTVPIEEAQELELDDWGLAGDEGLGELADLALVPGGGAALLDRLGAVVVIYGPNGGEVTRAGGPGEGPGELAPQGLSAVVATDSSLLVPDIQLQRITEFSVDGELLGTEDLGRAAGPAGGVFGVGWRAHPRGGLVLQELAPDGQRILRLHEGDLECLHSFDLPAVEPNQLLPPTPIWAMDPEGRLLAGRSDRARVALGIPGADEPEWTAAWPDREALPVSSRDRVHLEALVAESAEARGVPPVAVALPDQAPVLSGAMGDPEGRFWIQRATPIGEMGMEALRVGQAEGFGGRVWDILDSDGRPSGTVRLPSGFRPVEFGPREPGSGGEGSYCLYGIVEDGVGVRSARRVCP
jgi:hypothetical protein